MTRDIYIQEEAVLTTWGILDNISYVVENSVDEVPKARVRTRSEEVDAIDLSIWTLRTV
jgi:hypothetical protein